MGTFATVSVPLHDAKQLTSVADTTKAAFDQLEQELSTYNPTSDVSRVNRAAGSAPIQVSEHTICSLALAHHYASITDGRFDPTVGPLVQLWGFRNKQPPTTLPSAEAILSARQLVGYSYILIDEESSRAALAQVGMQVDLGGIAKGYAVDVAWKAVQKRGVENAMLNLGGNIRCMGRPRKGEAWRIGVRNPFDGNTIMGAIDLPAGTAVATSGNYERFVTINGTRYAHIIDPRSGHPVQGMAGVTVVSKSAVESDAMSTAFFVGGLANAADLLARTPDSVVLLIPDTLPVQIHVSSGMRAIFTPRPEFSDSVIDL